MIKKNKKQILGTLMGLSLFICGCLQYDMPENEQAQNNLSSINFPRNFNWSTQRQVNLNLSQTISEEPLTVELYYKIDERLYSIGKHIVNYASTYTVDIQLPSQVKNLYLKPLTGLYQEELSADVSENMTMRIQTSSFENKTSSGASSASLNLSKSLVSFSYLAPYNSSGKPNNVLPVRDIISQSMLSDINASLPEQRPVPVYNPNYLNGINMDSRVVDPADVWITFVTEGAGWRNAIGFYTYDLSKPLSSVSDIIDLQIIFPNSSLSGSGGSLMSGDKVFIGRFPANIGIGWFLVPDGWDGTQVLSKADIKFSNHAFNTFTTATNQQHVIALNDTTRRLILLGFEDTSRPGGDNDFNDAVFYITANPYTAIDVSNLNATKIAVDSDGDGVLDHLDDYPQDPTYAYTEYYPNANGVVGIAFEDMWPAIGDYDFNDLVFDLKYTIKKNAKNQVVQLSMNYNLKAIGGGHHNSLAIELGCAPSDIKSINGQLLSHGVFKTNSQGAEEASKDKTVIPIFDDAYDVFGVYNAGFINTEKSKAVIPSVNKTVTINFNTGVSSAKLGTYPFNPFIVVAKDRGHEIHLANQAPTSLANTKLFDTMDDVSSTKGYYLSEKGMPWAILTSESFKYPVERTPINTAHLKFTDWAVSGGRSYTDWFMNKSTYRDTRNIY